MSEKPRRCECGGKMVYEDGASWCDTCTPLVTIRVPKRLVSAQHDTLADAARPRSAPPREEESLTFADFSVANRTRCESLHGFGHPLGSWSTSDWMTALVGEVGEAANVVKKLNRYRDGVPGNKVSEAELRQHLRKECGDVFVYLDLLSQSLGFYIADAAVEVFNAKSAEIGYPEQIRAESCSSPVEAQILALAKEIRAEVLRIGRDFDIHTVPSLTVWGWMQRLELLAEASDEGASTGARLT